MTQYIVKAREKTWKVWLGALAGGTVCAMLLSLDFSGNGTAGENGSFWEWLSACFHPDLRQLGLLAIFTLLFRAFEYCRALESRRNLLLLGGVSLAFGLLNAAGQAMYYNDHLQLSVLGSLSDGLYASVLFFAAVLLLLTGLPWVFRSSAPSGRGVFWAAFGLILLGWLPWIISYYPCSADYDVYKPIMQYLNQIDRTDSFPWFYSTVVGSCYSLGLSLGDRNLGLFLHIALRTPVMAAIYAAVAQRLWRAGARKGVVWGVVLLYALVPVWGAYAKHGFKDVDHAAFFCWYILCTIEAVEQIRKGNPRVKTFALYAVSSLLASLFRNNCIYLVVPVTLLMAIALCRRPAPAKRRLALIALSMAGILAYGGYQVYTARVEHVASGGMGSALTIPFQQTARTVRDEGESVTEKEQALISSILDYDNLPELYDPILSDPVKDTFHDGKTYGKDYLLTWARMALKHPQAYLEAAVAQSYGYYAFTPDQAEHAGNENSGMTIFDWVKDARFSPELTGDYVAAMESVRIFLDNWAKTWHNLPVLGVLDELPLYTWFIVCVGLLMVWRRKWIRLIPVCALLLAVLFCCGSPVNDCFRYFAPVAAAAPACLLLCREDDAGKRQPIPNPADLAVRALAGTERRSRRLRPGWVGKLIPGNTEG